MCFNPDLVRASTLSLWQGLHLGSAPVILIPCFCSSKGPYLIQSANERFRVEHLAFTVEHTQEALFCTE